MDMIAMDVDEDYLKTRVNRPRKQRSVLDPPPPDETYYVRRPPGTNDSELPYLMKPEAFIYGHPRANPEFNVDLHEVLTDLGLVLVKQTWRERSTIYRCAILAAKRCSS
jgi:hypothetical protein